jgi:cytosine permease
MNNMLTFKVRDKDRQDGGGILALLVAGQWSCLPALMLGGMLIEGLSPGGLIVCVTAGGFILLACACFMGMQSCDSGLPSTVVSAEGLGVSGARYISALLIAVTSAGWFGVQTATCGASFSAMTSEILGLSVPAWASTLFWGFVMTVSVMYGYRSLKSFCYIMTPVLVLVLVYTLVHTAFPRESGEAAFLDWRPERSISYTTGIAMTVRAWVMGAFASGDFCRYAKNRRAVLLGLSAGLLPVMLAVTFCGAVLRVVTGTSDITDFLSGLGLPAIALTFLILSAWIINMLNAFWGGIAFSVLLGRGEERLKRNTALTGAIGTVLGAAGILSRYTDFLGLLTSLVPPVIGVLIGAKTTDTLNRKRSANLSAAGNGGRFRPGFHVPGIVAYGAGSLAAWFTATVFPFLIPSLNGIVVAAAVYVISEKRLCRHEHEHEHKIEIKNKPGRDRA